MKKMEFSYFYEDENEQYLFLQIPKALIKDDRFKELSSESKLLYSLLLERTSLSKKNGWKDEENRVYIIYPMAEIMEDLNCCDKSATKKMNELKQYGLVRVVHRGLNKPNIIYVMNFATDMKYSPKEKEEKEAILPRNRKKYESGTEENTNPEPKKVRANNIYQNKNNLELDISIYRGLDNTDTSIEQPTMTDRSSTPAIDKIDTTNKTYTPAEIANRICLTELREEYEDKQEEIEMLYGIICEVMTDNNPVTQTLRISRQNIPFSTVKDIFSCLEKKHIEYVIESLNKNDNKYKINSNTKSYLMTALFHAPRTITHYNNHSFQKQEPEKSKLSLLIEQKLERDRLKWNQSNLKTLPLTV